MRRSRRGRCASATARAARKRRPPSERARAGPRRLARVVLSWAAAGSSQRRSPVRTASAAFIPPISPAASTALRNALIAGIQPRHVRRLRRRREDRTDGRARIEVDEAEMQPGAPAASPAVSRPSSSGRRPAPALRRSPRACCRMPRRCPCRRPPGSETERSAGRRVPAIPARRSSAGCDRGSPSAQGRRPVSTSAVK